MAGQESLMVKLLGDASSLKNSLRTSQSSLDRFSKKIGKIGKQLSVKLTLPIITAGGVAVKFASDLQESFNKVDVTFKNSSNEVRDFAKTALKQFGLAEGSALDMAATFGDMATGMGLTTDASADLAKSLVALTGDLASFKNLRADEVFTALTGVFTGETESLKRLGVVMTEHNLKQFAVNQGIQKNIKDMTQQEKIMLRMQYVTQVTANAQGDFARTSGGAANQTRIFREGLKELAANFGQLILPAFTKVVKKLNGFVDGLRNMDADTKKIAITIAGLAAAIGPAMLAINGAIKVFGFLQIKAVAVTLAITGIIIAIDTFRQEIYSAGVLVSTGFLKSLLKLEHMFLKVAIRVQYFFDMLAAGFKREFGKFSLLTQKMKDDLDKFQTEFDIKEIELTFEAQDNLETVIPSFLEGFKDKIKALGDDMVEIFDSLFGAGGAAKIEPPKLDLAETFKVNPDAFEAKFKSITEMGKTMIANIDQHMKDADEAFQESLERRKKKLEESKVMISALSEGFMMFGDIVGSVFSQSNTVIGAFLQALLVGVGKQIAANAAASSANAVTAATESAKSTGPAAVFTLPVFIGAALAAVSAAFAKIPKFAKGGIVSSPTLAMVGEYGGASQNPEVIAPLDKLKSMIGDRQSQSVNVSGEFSLRGQDLVVALQRANRNRDRIL